MPVISMFFGIVIRMLYGDDQLMADWSLAVDGQRVFRIRGLE